MKKILGFDLGVASIGWCLILTTDEGEIVDILALGTRKIPIDNPTANDFASGKAFTKNQDATKKRSGRRNYDRYQLRRHDLTEKLRELGMLPDEHLIKLPVFELWSLRARAATKGKKLSLPEIGRVLYHINQRRGYKHGKKDYSADSKQREYVKAVYERYGIIQNEKLTIGQFFAKKLDETAVDGEHGRFYVYRIKEQVFPREAYEEEFDQIMECQREFYPEVLTDRTIDYLRNHVIFFQRDLKSCKHLVSTCEFEKREHRIKDGHVVIAGPKVAAKSNPLSQLDKIWEEVNNISLFNKSGDELYISNEQKQKLVDYLNQNEVLKATALYKILGVSKRDGWYLNKSLAKGLKGNTTLVQLREALSGLDNSEELLRFSLEYEESKKVDEETGEILKVISPKCIHQPLYRLWHAVYSIEDEQNLRKTLISNFGIENEEVIEKLFKLDFTKEGYGNKSVKAIREILPYLQEGLKYSDACEYAGFRHSDYLTKDENQSRQLLDKLPQIEKNELRQPIVEKVLNQMINIVNAIMARPDLGRPDVIRVELARELKMSIGERDSISKMQYKRRKENDRIEKILEEQGVRATRNSIERYRLWNESSKCCFYCGKVIGETEYLSGLGVETEHIIPKSLLFDNSYSNKVCACKKCNKEKDNTTAYDYMCTKGQAYLEDYLTRVDDLFTNGVISKTKRDRLLMKAEDIPQDFINRDLRLTQYISRKAMEILRQVCRDVTASSGSVTDFIRHTWGYDQILENINFERYKTGDLTEFREYVHKGQTHKKEVIKDWTKRNDHRHHAIDAFVVAMTTPSIIQRLNTLNTSRDAMFKEVEAQRESWKNDYSLLEQWLREKKHLRVDEVQRAVEGILVSARPGVKIASTGTAATYSNGKRKIVQRGVIVPRGALHEESVYGKIQLNGKNEIVIKYKLGVGNSGFLFTGKEDYKAESVKNKKTGLVEIKVIDKIKNVLDTIVDGNIRKRVLDRLNEGFANGQDYRNDPKKALENLRNLEEKPVYADDSKHIQIKSIRCTTGKTAVVPLKFGEHGEPVSFVVPGNNHHVSFYKDEAGHYQESIITLWQAVERRRFHVPVIIENPAELWDSIQDKELPDTLLESLPGYQWKHVLSLQRNELVVLGMDEADYQEAIRKKDKVALNKYLYSVQNLSHFTYRFCLATAVGFDLKLASKKDKRFLNISSIATLFNLNPHKVHIDILGEIITE